MNELIQKISSYNIFNFLLPGIIFVVFLSRVSEFNLIMDDILLALFFYYFLGLVLSRIGSLLIEPILLKTGFVKFSKYEKFLEATKEDKGILLQNEINNSFRTLISVFVMILFAMLFEKGLEYFHVNKDVFEYLLVLSIIIIFLFSFRKQSSYLRKRINIKN